MNNICQPITLVKNIQYYKLMRQEIQDAAQEKIPANLELTTRACNK